MNTNNLKLLQQSLPKCPGICGKDEFINAAVLVPFVSIGNEYHLLFEQRTHNIRQGNEICFPGGIHQPGSDLSLEETSIRETIEELGINRDRINILGALDTVFAPMGLTIDPYIGTIQISSLDELVLDKNEVQRVFTIPVAFFEKQPEQYQVRLEVQPSYIDSDGKEHILLPAKELGLPSRYTRPWGGLKSNVYVYKTNEGIIWGLTARIIYTLVKKYLAPLG